MSTRCSELATYSLCGNEVMYDLKILCALFHHNRIVFSLVYNHLKL